MAVRYSWTQPSCGECWYTQNPDRTPIRFKEPDDETCCFCNNRTSSGIYVRVDPEQVPYPSMEKD